MNLHKTCTTISHTFINLINLFVDLIESKLIEFNDINIDAQLIIESLFEKLFG